jgi:ankyrin repeat protein
MLCSLHNSKNGDTALHKAADGGYAKTCQVLLVRGANPHVMNKVISIFKLLCLLLYLNSLLDLDIPV